MRLVRAVGRAVEELAGELVPRQPPVADELAQRVLGADLQQVVQLIDEVSGLGVVDERLGGCDQGAETGEVDAGERPEAVLVEVDQFVQRVEAAAMRVAVAGGQVLEPAERGAPAGAGTECRDHLGQRGDGLLAEQGNDRVGGELGWSHCGTITDSGFRNGATNRAPGPAKRSRPGGAQSAGERIPRPVGSSVPIQQLLGSYFCADPKGA